MNEPMGKRNNYSRPHVLGHSVFAVIRASKFPDTSATRLQKWYRERQAHLKREKKCRQA